MLSVNAPASHDPEVAGTELNSSTVHPLVCIYHIRTRRISLSLSLFSFSLSLQSSLSGCLTTFSHCISVYVCVCARAHATIPEVDARQYALTMCLPAYVHTGVRREVCGSYIRNQVRTICDIYCTGVPAFYQVNMAFKRVVDYNKVACPIFLFNKFTDDFCIFFNSVNWDRPIC